MEKKEITLGTLLTAVMIIAVCVVVMIPHYKMAVEKAAARSTMADMNLWADAIEDYTTEHSASPSNPNGSISYKKTLVREVLPYIRILRIKDWWGNPYWIWTEGALAQYGLSLEGKGDYLIVSLGSDGIRENWNFSSSDPEAGFFPVETFLDFEKDIVLYNQTFVRIPERTKLRPQ